MRARGAWRDDVLGHSAFRRRFWLLARQDVLAARVAEGPAERLLRNQIALLCT
jgi:hypothetical protein